MPGTQSQLGGLVGLVGGRWKIRGKLPELGLNAEPQVLSQYHYTRLSVYFSERKAKSTFFYFRVFSSIKIDESWGKCLYERHSSVQGEVKPFSGGGKCLP